MTLDDIFQRGRLSPKVLGPQTQNCVRSSRRPIGLSSGSKELSVANRQAAQKTFPREYLREIGRWRIALPFVRSTQVRDSVADTLMMHDVQAWVLKRTDLAGHARDMLVKAAIGALGSIAEALLIDATSPQMGQRQKFAARVKRLREEGVLADPVAADLEWLWEIRNRQHLHALSAREFDVYTSKDHPRAESVVASLIVALQRRKRAPAA